MRVAIVGSGISGLAAAHALSALPRRPEVVMYEAAARPGGHVYTVLADGHAIDMGFIVHSRPRYPRFCALLDELGIQTRTTPMSFSVSHGDLEWGSESLAALFAQRRRLTDPRHWRFLAQVMAFLWRAQRDIERFHRECGRAPEPIVTVDGDGQLFRELREGSTRETRRAGREVRAHDHALHAAHDTRVSPREHASHEAPDDHNAHAAHDERVSRREHPSHAAHDESVSQPEPALPAARYEHELRASQHALARLSLDEYLSQRRVSRDVRDRFVVPLAAALWSLAPAQCGEFPALTYLRFLDHHGMLSPIRPLPWRTIAGGSQRYVDALLARLDARGRFSLRPSTVVQRIERTPNGIRVDGERFDDVVIATHADTALRLLADPTDDERRVLGAFRYSTNRTVLHTDRSFLPRAPAAHAAWNYVADPDTSRVSVTYSMTRLQGLPDRPYLVTLNPRREPRGILHEVTFTHPQFDRAALAAQTELPRINGTRRTYYAGAHFGFGFHEDGARSGAAAIADLICREADYFAARAS